MSMVCGVCDRTT